MGRDEHAAAAQAMSTVISAAPAFAVGNLISERRESLTKHVP